MQQDFDFNAPALGTDPDTSAAAAEKMQPKLPTLRQRALDLIQQSGLEGMTNSELVDVMACPPRGVQPRTSELRDAGLIEDSGQRRANIWGNPEIVWRTRNEHCED